VKVTSETATASLVRRAQSGETAAFAPLVHRYLRAAYSVALAIVGRRADAEDVAQDALIVALERIGSCREPERFGGWLLQIVRNRALNWIDSRRLRDVAPDDRQPDVPVAPVAPERADVESRLLAALACLTVAQREVVLLHDLEEWTHAEIGAAIGISEVMSRQHLFNARRALRARLGDKEALGG
jgi:RNA polymerase sigma-70 factor (ECF subfamily)